VKYRKGGWSWCDAILTCRQATWQHFDVFLRIRGLSGCGKWRHEIHQSIIISLLRALVEFKDVVHLSPVSPSFDFVSCFHHVIICHFIHHTMISSHSISENREKWQWLLIYDSRLILAVANYKTNAWSWRRAVSRCQRDTSHLKVGGELHR